MRHTVGNFLTRATTLLETSLQLEACIGSYAPSKLRESQLLEWEQKTIWMWPPWRGAEYTIRGKGGGFPQVWAMVSLVCLSCPWLVLTPKVLQLCTNHFVWVLCRFVWVIEASLLPSPILELHHAPLPFYSATNMPRLLVLPLFSVWDSHLNPSRSWECVTRLLKIYL